MFKTITCYEGYEKYLMTSERFTLEQRYLYAIHRYFGEVIKRRHHQFFYNSTGIFWENALNGFKHFGIPEFAANFQKVIDCYGGTISFDREERWNMLESLEEKNEEEFFGILDEVDDFAFEYKVEENKFNYIIQEFMDCEDCDADVYIDYYNHQPVAAFSKKKLETKIGGASKTISFKDHKLFDFIEEICKVLTFNGPVDMDFWYKDGQYFLSEVNPRFGGAYLHAYGAGVDFFKLIQNNMEGKTNESIIGKYEDDVLMMMYDSVVIVNKDELVK